MYLFNEKKGIYLLIFILQQGLRWDVIKSVLTDPPLVFTLSGAIHSLTYRMGYGSSLKAVCQSLCDVLFICGLVSCYHLFDISSFYHSPLTQQLLHQYIVPLPLLFQKFLGHTF